MHEKSTVQVHISLIGDSFDTGHVTQLMNLTPTKTHQVDEILGNGKKFGHVEWNLTSEEEPSVDAMEQFGKLFDKIHEKSNIMNQLRTLCNAEWHILFTIQIENGDVPAIYLPQDIVQFAANIHAQFGYDVYVLSERK